MGIIKNLIHSEKERIYGLDILRAIAILLVLYRHGKSFFLQNFFPFLNNIKSPDAIDLFFVLSGFLIGGILIKEFDKEDFSRKRVINFWKRRWFRTLPLYFVFLIFLITTSVLINKVTFTDIEFWKYFLFVQNFNTQMPGFFDPSWSLTIEEWFYLLIPIFLISTSKIFKKLMSKDKIFLSTLSLLIILPLTIRIIHFNNLIEIGTSLNWTSWEYRLRKVLIFRMDTLMYGILGAYFFIRHPEKWFKYRKPAFILGITIFLTHLIINKNIFYTSFYGNTFYFSTIALSILLMLPLLSNIKKYNGKIGEFLTFISIISYSLYLIHFAVYDIGLYFFTPNSKLSGLISFIAFLLISISISALTYKYIEKPFLKLREKEISLFRKATKHN